MGYSHGGIKRTAADDWFSKALRLAYPICQMCETRPSSQACHIKRRRVHATRYCVDNVLAGCDYCHRWMESEPLDFTDWIESRHPGRKDRIQLKARGFLKNSAYNRKLIATHYRGEYRRMESTGDRNLESWN